MKRLLASLAPVWGLFLVGAPEFGPTDVVGLEMRDKTVVLSVSDGGVEYQVADKETQLVGRKLDESQLKRDFPQVYRLLDRSLAPLLATR